MVAAQGDIYWADLPPPVGSGPGFRRPVVVVQSDIFNRSRIATVVCIPLTSNVTRADSPGNVLLKASGTGLPKDSIASVPQILSVDRRLLLDRVGQVSHGELGLLLRGIDIVLGR